MRTPRLELGQEYHWPNEAQFTERIAEISQNQIQRNEKGVAQREQHPKQQGCLWAEFTVGSDFPDELKVGLFKEAKTYPAWVRTSNVRQQDDRKGDAHGFALKIMNVPGEKVLEAEKDATTHDLLFTDHPVFLIRDIQEYIEFFEISEQAHGQPPFKFLFPSANPATWRLREAKTLLIDLAIVKGFFTKVSSPLAIQYWSMTPYRLGNKAIKFFIKPDAQNQVPLKNDSPNYLREAMTTFLREHEARFDFFVQVQTDPEKMPVEDPRIEWVGCPEYQLATIRILKQHFDTEAQQTFGENLSLTPWHCLSENQPIGSINRTRKIVYERTSSYRHQLNNVPKEEPTPETFQPQLLE